MAPPSSASSSTDPYRNFKFRVSIEGIQVAGFSDVTLADTSTDPIDYREGTDPNYVRKLSGMVKYGNVTLKKGLMDQMTLYNWRRTVETQGSEAAEKTVTVTLQNSAGKDGPVWDFYQAWPSKYSNGELTGKSADVLLETLELTIGYMVRQK